MKKKITKKVLVKTPSVTKTALKEAYQLVKNDLFNNLLKMKNKERLTLRGIGTFVKKKSQRYCGWDKNTYLNYRVSFRTSDTLKRALEKSL